MRDQARRQAELILSEAHAEARGIQRNALAENERLTHESRRLRAQLREALSALGDDETTDATGKHDEAAAPAGDAEEERSWYGAAEQAADAA
jgi:vacuolar-type H+-ATPase subunit E/Vma4